MLENKKPFETPISSLGEFKLIDRLTEKFTIKNENTILGIGDDAAIIESENQILISTDILSEGIHFDLAYVPLKHLGYKAVVTNLSDICAMNATPKQILVSLAVSSRFPVEALDEIYFGIQSACQKYSIDLIGGDTTASKSGLIISITVIGEAKKENIVKRNGANPTDLLVVTGDLGGAFMGLKILQRENVTFQSNPNFQPDLSEYNYIIQRQLKPEARTDIKKILEDLNIKPTSMIDISDGLSSEILHLSKQSNIGFHIYEEKIPMDNQTINTADEFNLNPATACLNGGEDYELLFTIPIGDFDKLKNQLDFTIIGHATEKNASCYLLTRGNNQLIPISAQGWNLE